MCGIFGMVKNGPIENELIEGLKRLEYRGYDSSGIAFVKNNKIEAIKKVGQIANLENELAKQNNNYNWAIAHTRWATHGKVNEQNSHPHLSESGQFALVHNGIIENYKSLKDEHLKNVKFKSTTDTEVVVHLIEKFHDGDTLKTLHKVCGLIKGSYAFALIDLMCPNTIFATKNESPLVVAKGKNETVISSDTGSVVNYNSEQYVLENNEFVVVLDNNVVFYDNSLVEFNKKSVVVDVDESQLGKLNYDHFMLKEINDVPNVVNETLKKYHNANEIYKNVPKSVLSKVKEINIVACGTAYHAGLFGKRIIEELVGVNVHVFIASEFRYMKKPVNKNSLNIFISQSGETADTIGALKVCKSLGLKTLSVVNVVNSLITSLSDYVLYTKAGREIAVASTKAYIAQVATLYLLAFAIYESRKEKLELGLSFDDAVLEIKKLISYDKLIESLQDQVKHFVNDYVNVSSIYLIGRQKDFLTSLEGALKLKEITYINCEAYPAGELKHGTISLITQDVLVVAFLTQQDVIEKTLNAVHEVKSRGARVLIVTTQPPENFEEYYDDIVVLPPFNDFYVPIVSMLPIQLLSYELSVARGINPDKPRNLAKSVTVE